MANWPENNGTDLANDDHDRGISVLASLSPPQQFPPLLVNQPLGEGGVSPGDMEAREPGNLGTSAIWGAQTAPTAPWFNGGWNVDSENV